MVGGKLRGCSTGTDEEGGGESTVIIPPQYAPPTLINISDSLHNIA